MATPENKSKPRKLRYDPETDDVQITVYGGDAPADTEDQNPSRYRFHDLELHETDRAQAPRKSGNRE